MWIWLMSSAFAAPPDDIRPVLAPLDAPDQYAEYMRSQGRSDVLACEPVWRDAALQCWKYGAGSWATRADLREWGTSHEALVASTTERARTALAAGWTEVTVPGITGSYFEAPDPDGLAHAAVFLPELLRQVTGGQTVYVSAPVEGVLLAWQPGNAELNHAIAVGARKMFDASTSPSTPVVFQHTGRWVPFAEATPRGEP